MKIRKLFLTIGVIVLIATLIALVIIFSLNGKKEDCEYFTGGSFTINYYDGNNILKSNNVCIACPPDSYDDIYIPEKEGYTFEGWYYDKKLTEKVNATTTLDISAVGNYDKNECLIGYKDINLYAKWSNK